MPIASERFFSVIDETPEANIEEAATGGATDVPTSSTSINGPSRKQMDAVEINLEELRLADLFDYSTNTWLRWTDQPGSINGVAK